MRGAGRSQTMDIDIDARYLSAMPGPQSLSSPQSPHTPRLLLAKLIMRLLQKLPENLIEYEFAIQAGLLQCN